MAGAVCFVVWRITPLLDRLNTMGEGLDIASILSQGKAAPAGQPASDADELVIYSPKGDTLSPEERQRLLAAAARLRPRVREKPTRVSLPGDHPVETTVMTPGDTTGTESIDIEQLVTPEMMQALLEQIQNQQ